MGQRMAVAAEDVVIEQRPPRLALLRRAFSNRDHAQKQGGVGRVRADTEGIPPIVDQPVEGSGRLHLMPPELRKVQRVPGTELGCQRLVPDFLEQWKLRGAPTVRGSREAYGLSGHGVVDGTDVQLAYELRRIECEAAPPADHAGQVVEGVVVARDVRGRS